MRVFSIWATNQAENALIKGRLARRACRAGYMGALMITRDCLHWQQCCTLSRGARFAPTTTCSGPRSMKMPPLSFELKLLEHRPLSDYKYAVLYRIGSVAMLSA